MTKRYTFETSSNEYILADEFDALIEINEELDTKNTDQMIRINDLESEINDLESELKMLEGLLDELINDIDSGDICQAKKTLRRYRHGYY